MEAVSKKRQVTVVDILERVIEKEREAIHLYQHNASSVTDPDVKTMFLSLASKRYEFFAEIYDQLVELRSGNEITMQINDMFQ